MADYLVLVNESGFFSCIADNYPVFGDIEEAKLFQTFEEALFDVKILVRYHQIVTTIATVNCYGTRKISKDLELPYIEMRRSQDLSTAQEDLFGLHHFYRRKRLQREQKQLEEASKTNKEYICTYCGSSITKRLLKQDHPIYERCSKCVALTGRRESLFYPDGWKEAVNERA